MILRNLLLMLDKKTKTLACVVAGTKKLLTNSSYGYQNIDRSRHSVTKYLNDDMMHAAIDNKLSKRPPHIND